MRHLFSNLRRDDRGTTAITFAIAAIPLVGVMGLAVDYSRAYRVQSHLQTAVDAAALAGATEATDDPQRPFAAFFVFLRWAGTGAGIMAHLETGDVAFGNSEEEAKAAALELSLYEVKEELDQAIRRKKTELE